MCGKEIYKPSDGNIVLIRVGLIMLLYNVMTGDNIKVFIYVKCDNITVIT